MPLAALLGAIAWPLVSRVLVALGIGIVTYAGMDVALTAALDASKAAMGGLPANAAAILAMAGVFQAMGIIAGGLVAGVALMVTTRFALRSAGA